MDDLIFEVDDETLEKLKQLAKQHGVTVEEEARRLIIAAVMPGWRDLVESDSA